MLVRMILTLSWHDFPQGSSTDPLYHGNLIKLLGELEVLQAHLELLICTLQIFDVVLLHQANRQHLVIVLLQGKIWLSKLYNFK